MKKKKCGYAYLKEKVAKLENKLEYVTEMRDFMGERYVWLYNHAPFYLKWWFKHTFKQ